MYEEKRKRKSPDLMHPPLTLLNGTNSQMAANTHTDRSVCLSYSPQQQTLYSQHQT